MKMRFSTESSLKIETHARTSAHTFRGPKLFNPSPNTSFREIPSASEGRNAGMPAKEKWKMKYKIEIQNFVDGTVQTTEFVSMKAFINGVMGISKLKKRGSDTTVDIVEIYEDENEIVVFVEIQRK